MPEGLGVSRSRLVALIQTGHLRDEARELVQNPSAKPRPLATYYLDLPQAETAEAGPEDIPLDIVFEDGDVIVLNKPAGMVVHPAPGSPSGTLVNALLHHAGGSLSGIGGVARPGIVHRIDKDTSGLMVVAKNDLAHQSLSAQFAAHSIDRVYDAFVWGSPSASQARLAGLPPVAFEKGGTVRITASMGRHPTDRKKMAVVKSGGRHAVTRAQSILGFGETAAYVSCRLETGRTHQIRVHMSHIGHPLIGDPVYGRGRSMPNGAPDEAAVVIKEFGRQALHARLLGFEHPTLGEFMRFEREWPEDMSALKTALEQAFGSQKL